MPPANEHAPSSPTSRRMLLHRGPIRQGGLQSREGERREGCVDFNAHVARGTAVGGAPSLKALSFDLVWTLLFSLALALVVYLGYDPALHAISRMSKDAARLVA